MTAEAPATQEETPAQRLAGLLRDDLERQMPGCDIHVRSLLKDCWSFTATHRITGRTMTGWLGSAEWRISCHGASTSGGSAYGWDSAICHAYRHDLDFTSDHGPGTAWAYANR